jgi:MSHA pilin protein MshC
MKLISVNSVNYQKNNGFSLIELVVVILMISIMAVTVLPKFFTSNGFEEFTYRDEIITKLRAIQLRSMQQTTGTICKGIQLETAPSAIIGLQATDLGTNACTTDYAGDTTTVIVNPKHSVSFTLSEGLTNFSFSAEGKPLGCISESPCKITITIAGENSPKILINSEGYIYAI